LLENGALEFCNRTIQVRIVVCAALLQIFYAVRSERLLMEQLTYNLLSRWFVGLEMDEPVWNHAVFSKNRERLRTETLPDICRIRPRRSS
jgi:hypothetical protein